MHRFLLTGLLPVILATTGEAQNHPVVTESDFLSVLDAAHPAIAASGEALAVARAGLTEAATLGNPVAGLARENPSGPVEQTDWMLSWQLPRPGRGRRIEAQNQRVAAAEAQRTQELLGLRAILRKVFAEWAVAAARAEGLTRQAERVEGLARREAARLERGESSGLESRRLSLAATALRSEVALSVATAVRALAAARTWNPAIPLDARPVLPPLPPPPRSPVSGFGVRAAEAELAAAEAEQQAAGRVLDSPEISLGWQRQEAASESIDGPLFAVSWSLPILDRRRAEKEAAQARLAGAQARLEIVRRSSRNTWVGALAVYESLLESLDSGFSSLEDGTRTLDAAEAAFRLGEASLTDLLDTHRLVAEAELARLELYAAALAAHRDLDSLAGVTVSSDTISERQESLP